MTLIEFFKQLKGEGNFIFINTKKLGKDIVKDCWFLLYNMFS